MSLRVLRPRFYVNTDHRFAQGAQGFEAGVAEFQAELVFAFCVERVVAFVAGGVCRTLALFFYVDFWMDFERVHKTSPARVGHADCQIETKYNIEGNRLKSSEGIGLRE
jgi:hypothetical protein